MAEPETDIYHDGILPLVQRPSRYIDRELNLTSGGFKEDLFNVLLVFPDLYEIGMSHQGIRFLYQRLAVMEGVGVEFAFAPWPDLEKHLKESGVILRSWQSATPASRFDLLGFSLTYELHYTNMLMILELAGLDVTSGGRCDDDPIVVAGGPCCTDPLPFIEAVDAVFLGDGEESLPEAVKLLRDCRARGAGRREMREALAGIEGVFVDGISTGAATRLYRIGAGDLASKPIVPASEIVHDRLTVELMRGCTRGCRFCHAGILYRPRRERDVEGIVSSVCAGLDATGWDEVSLLSLSTSDYSSLGQLLAHLTPELERRRVSLALPSLRPETVTEQIVAASGHVRKSGFTLAPEAGTVRLRRVINKGMDEESILEGCRRILEAGWQNIKLYFMIGLPTETEEDLQGLVDLVHAILRLPRRGGRFKLGVAVSPFVPKPHTPFQWERQCSIEELREKERFISERLRSRRIHLTLRNPEVSILEGIFARGDRTLWPVLLSAYRSGCRFDGWHDQFRFDRWRAAFEEHGLVVSDLLGPFEVDRALPWDIIATRVEKRFLIAERERAFTEEFTPDCREGECGGCGACRDGRDTDSTDASGPPPDAGAPYGGHRNETADRAITGHRRSGDAERTQFKDRPVKSVKGEPEAVRSYRYRCVYEKRDRMRFLSHIETLNTLQRAVRRTGLPINFTEGFHPRPRLSYGPPLGVGMEGYREFFDMELVEPAPVTPGLFAGLLPDGLRVLDCRGPFSRSSGTIPSSLRFVFRLSFGGLERLLKGIESQEEHLFPEQRLWYLLGKRLLPRDWTRGEMRRWIVGPARSFEEQAVRLLAGGGPLVDERGKERSTRDCTVERSADGAAVELTLVQGGGITVRPRDLINAVLPPPLAGLVKVTRLGIQFRTGDRYEDILDALDMEG
ncbi:MAG: DUF2344 domain-containing protein [bacterium]|nr:MAG: DUF2344 domain-containing protein [bacterium]